MPFDHRDVEVGIQELGVYVAFDPLVPFLGVVGQLCVLPISAISGLLTLSVEDLE